MTACSSTCRKTLSAREAIKVDLKLDTDGAAVNWRTLVVLEKAPKPGSGRTTSSASDGTDALLNTVVELVVGQGQPSLRRDTGPFQKAWLFSTSGSRSSRTAPARLGNPRFRRWRRQGPA